MAYSTFNFVKKKCSPKGSDNFYLQTQTATWNKQKHQEHIFFTDLFTIWHHHWQHTNCRQLCSYSSILKRRCNTTPLSYITNICGTDKLRPTRPRLIHKYKQVNTVLYSNFRENLSEFHYTVHQLIEKIFHTILCQTIMCNPYPSKIQHFFNTLKIRRKQNKQNIKQWNNKK